MHKRTTLFEITSPSGRHALLRVLEDEAVSKEFEIYGVLAHRGDVIQSPLTDGILVGFYRLSYNGVTDHTCLSFRGLNALPGTTTHVLEEIAAWIAALWNARLMLVNMAPDESSELVTLSSGHTIQIRVY